VKLTASEAIEQTLDHTQGLTAYLAGSSAAAVVYANPMAYSDVDLFVPNEGMYFVVGQRLIDLGYEMDDRFERTWSRHKDYGFNHFHTNSLKLTSPDGTEVNVIYKRVDGHETTRLSQVLESFDFGLLGVGYETETGQFRDMRSYLFPDAKDLDVLPMMDYRATTVGKGYMSQHIMLRTPGRYARYVQYGYDLSLVKPTLVEGYLAYHAYKADRTKDEDLTLGQIALALAHHLDTDNLSELIQFEKSLPMADGLDAIMSTLE
jgi:hypothetical protein